MPDYNFTYYFFNKIDVVAICHPDKVSARCDYFIMLTHEQTQDIKHLPTSDRSIIHLAPILYTLAISTNLLKWIISFENGVFRLCLAIVCSSAEIVV